ncbi:xanthine dehydrogenase family protein molybdopterin-binding subunit [Flammeovirga kamogawensis]|uniref:Molybdopterin-dependent oxidoreductase n=1 Tax=Flammeovirga kamogawensis TaxID=373891 RepID=A0ABX8GT71_9BACT|nr:molybdopterin cofactor-binding domain-containing protein [Flammeovirga kamogawensis]MBB6463885.1 isoquinoline 1-oxidoreductase beta subunit [Flammeovirga kamogawensis]QWG06591.1 molybdopterin-dependent oxidoreductase [Flammeovirga kamogawensis]TRX68417.1 xanthine dehydrogenase family protein molybdopterin-binding subunit [Flammeovirga kamogawensis]
MQPKEVTQQSRRNFLKTSLLTGGGLLMGLNFLGTSCAKNAEMPKSIEDLDFQSFNAYLKIADNNTVSIYAPNPEIGQGVKTSMPMIIAEELDIPWENVVVVQAGLNSEYKRQVAGGSQSIRLGWKNLRKAGATAKLMLLTAAANKWNIPVEECVAKQGVITNKKGDSIKYGDVVNEAALLEIPKKAPLKNVEDFTLIGKGIKNVDVEKIVKGESLFGLDYKYDGMKYAMLQRPPFGAKLASFDDTDTKKIKGVLTVVSFDNKVAVVAENTWAAMKGKEALKVEWKEIKKKESTAYHNEMMLAAFDKKGVEPMQSNGNFNTAVRNADMVIEQLYEAPFLPHNCMEPLNFFAHVTKNKILLVGPTQTPKNAAQKVAGNLGRKEEEVEVQMTRMGGGFGRRLNTDFAEEAAYVSNLSGYPVKVIFTREDDMTSGVYRPSVKYKIKATIKGGELTGYTIHEAVINRGMWKGISKYFPNGAIENYEVRSSAIECDTTIGWWRAPVTNFLGFAQESFLDDIASELKKDPIQFRLSLLDNAKRKKGIPYSPKRLQGVIKLVAEKGNWGKVEKGVYQGFAAYFSHNSYIAEIADITIENNKPVVKKVTVAVDCGILINKSGAKNQIEGSVIDGIGHALYGNLEVKDGVAQVNNFDHYQLIRMKDTPIVSTHFIESSENPSGLGEPGLPPASVAVANAYKKATGKRITKQPMMNEMIS